eukprot:3197173-Amphidinium_carterae.1
MFGPHIRARQQVCWNKSLLGITRCLLKVPAEGRLTLAFGKAYQVFKPEDLEAPAIQPNH